MKTSRERAEDIEMWEEMCYCERRLDGEQKGVVADSLCSVWEALKANTDAIIEPERLESLAYCALIIIKGYDTFDNATKYYQANLEEHKVVRYLLEMLEANL